ncbi:MAG: type II secretion system protein [Parashewanella sp.]
MSKEQSGFTLIELVVAIIILGILAVTAAPKFINFTGDANRAKNDGFFAAFSSVIKIYSAKARMAGLSEKDDLIINGSNIIFFNYLPECVEGRYCKKVQYNDGLIGKSECEELATALLPELLQNYNVLNNVTSGPERWSCQFRLKDASTIGFKYRPEGRVLEIVE